MSPNQQLLSEVPPRLILPVMLALLLLLRRRHPRLAMRSWVPVLGAVLMEQLGWFVLVFAHNRPTALAGHTLEMEGQLFLALVLAAQRSMENSRAPGAGFWINAIPPAAFCAFYGCYVLSPLPYVIAAAAGVVTCLSTAVLSRIYLRSLAAGAAFGVSLVLAAHHHLRGAAYWLLFAAYAFAVARLMRSLPPRTLGKVAILVSISVWGVSFLLHPWLLHVDTLRAFADNLWQLQQYFLCMGILLLLLEDQVAGNRWLALHDQLTELPNRRLLDDQLDQALSDARENNTWVCVLLIDLNGFKAINDTFGHPVGDFVLVESARRMETLLLPAHTLARLGGDEFVVVLACAPGAPLLDTIEDRLQQSISQPFHFNGQQVTVSGSFGRALYPHDAPDAQGKRVAPTLLHIADQRMYAAKLAARSQPLSR